MKHAILICLVFFISTGSGAQAPTFSWATQVDGNISIAAQVTDAAGNLYTTGSFTGTVDFDPGPGVVAMTDHGFGDIFITRTDSSGNLIWAKHMGSTSYDEGSAIATDASGNIYVTGFFSDTVDFDPGPGVAQLVSGENSFVLKLSGAGSLVWVKQLSSISQNYATGLTLDNQGNILVTGKFEGTADFDPGSASSLLNAFVADIYIWKLNSTGDLVWAKQIAALPSGTRSYSIATDGSGNIFLAGLLAGTTDLDPGTTVFNLTSSSLAASFFLKLNSSGGFVWAKKMDNVDILLANRSIVVDANGNIYLGGSFSGTVDFDPGIGTQNLTSTSGNSSFLLKLDSSAAFAWLKQLSDVSSITVDAAGSVYTCGTSTNKFSPGGVAQWTLSNTPGSRISVDEWGGIYTTGAFTGTVDFDPGSGVYNLTSPSGGNNFYQRLRQKPVLGVQAVVPAGSSFIVYPNPGSEVVYLRSTIAGTFILLNSTGQVVRTVDAMANKATSIETANLASGMYTISDGRPNGARKTVVVAH